ncbi:MAG: alpha,alpha-phosphotrehalase, partial [Erysipelotrichales bacterium]|nr:alpha,alpha-phosphotrehalase [Erysipelotrichales bacterium]
MKLNNQSIYQIYPKSFKDTNGDGIGDLPGIISQLDTLSHLGIDYLWLSPIMKSPQRDNGYDIADYYHIDPMFGSDEDYFRLIQEANKRGIKIMMDLVLNHVSTEHEWFKRACEGDPYYQDFFIWRKRPNELKSLFGGSAWEYVPQ